MSRSDAGAAQRAFLATARSASQLGACLSAHSTPLARAGSAHGAVGSGSTQGEPASARHNKAARASASQSMQPDAGRERRREAASSRRKACTHAPWGGLRVERCAWCGASARGRAAGARCKMPSTALKTRNRAAARQRPRKRQRRTPRTQGTQAAARAERGRAALAAAPRVRARVGWLDGCTTGGWLGGGACAAWQARCQRGGTRAVQPASAAPAARASGGASSSLSHNTGWRKCFTVAAAMLAAGPLVPPPRAQGRLSLGAARWRALCGSCAAAGAHGSAQRPERRRCESSAPHDGCCLVPPFTLQPLAQRHPFVERCQRPACRAPRASRSPRAAKRSSRQARVSAAPRVLPCTGGTGSRGGR